MPPGGDPLDDPLVAAWDAIVTDSSDALDRADPADVALLRRLHSLETIPLPSLDFFDGLQRHLLDLAPAPGDEGQEPAHSSTRPTHRSAISNSAARSFLRKPRPALTPSHPESAGWIPRHTRWVSVQRAAVALALLAIVGLVVLYQVVPRTAESPVIPAAVVPEPTMEPMVQFDFTPPLLGFPDATNWDYMAFDYFQIDPGESFSTNIDWYTLIGGPLMITVVSGELAIHPRGPALFYPADEPDRQPVEIPAGQTVSIGPNDTIVYSSGDSATGDNLGSQPAIALLGNIGKMGNNGIGSDSAPLDLESIDRHNVYDLPGQSTPGASISIQRLRLEPFDSFVFDPDAAWTYLCVFDQFRASNLRIAAGELDGLSPDIDAAWLYTSAQLNHPDPGPHTIFNLGDQTVDLYFLVVEPRSDEDDSAE